jgi:hypothetical protein
MSKERVIRVVLCGSVLSCESDDRISIEFSPDELRRLTEIFLHRSLEAETFGQQGFEREMKKIYSDAREKWRGERDNKND